MSTIEASIVLKVSDSDNINQIISEIQQTISSINGKPTSINIVQVDDPLTTNLAKTTEIQNY